ncbi:MAG: hypothetical protein ACRD30_03535, partial [Bryobacteraceae bacterium]
MSGAVSRNTISALAIPLVWALLAANSAPEAVAADDTAPELLTLEQAASRQSGDMAPVYEGRSVAVRGQVDSRPVWALGTYYLALRDEAGHGLIVSGGLDRLGAIAPGDWIEATGAIRSRAAMPT